jgi:N6-adenosine-specific RNA methylase IME4
MSVWGFTYKSNFVWVKDRIGMGHWNRGKHEHLLIGTRGSIPAPAHGLSFESVIMEPKGKHSAKPARAREMIEKMFPSIPRVELFSRGSFAGWIAHGVLPAEAVPPARCARRLF